MSLRSENVFSWVGSLAIQYYDGNSCFLELIGFSISLKLFLLLQASLLVLGFLGPGEVHALTAAS